MARLTKAQAAEVAEMKPFAECVTEYHTKVVVITINHWEVDEIVVKFDDEAPRMYRIQTHYGNGGDIDTDFTRPFFTAKGRRWYLDEFARYDSPWMGGRL